jgi:hypothetical protein
MPCFNVQGDLMLTPDGRGFVGSSGMARLVQRIRIGLQTPTGYWRWDQTLGFPVLSNDLEKLTLPIFKTIIRRYLFSHPEIVSIPILVVNSDATGVVTVTYTARTDAEDTIQDTVPFMVVN